MVLIPDWLNSFLTPLFLAGAGALLGLAVLIALWGVVWLISRRAGAAIPQAVKDGPLLWVFWIATAFASLALLIVMVIFDRDTLLSSFQRLPATRTLIVTGEALPSPDPNRMAEPPVVKIPVQLRGDEIKSIAVQSNEPLVISLPPDDKGVPRASLSVDANDPEPHENRRGIYAGINITEWRVVNEGTSPARFELRIATQPEHPEVMASVLIAVALVAIFLVYFAHTLFFRKATAVALAACKSEMAHPLYLVLLVMGLVLMAIFTVLPYFTLGEDIKVLKDSGLVLIVTFCIFHAVLAASNQVFDEIEGRTAITVLSKPISRAQFLLGKWLGIAWAEFVLVLTLGTVFLVIVSYKVIYESGETASELPTWQVVFRETAQTFPGLVLVYLETLVFVSISVAIATRLPLMANFVICFAIYALGHLTPQIVQSGLGKNGLVDFMGKLIATVLPVLDDFNVYAGIAGGSEIPWSYLGMATVYCALYCLVAILLGLALFDDRDLA